MSVAAFCPRCGHLLSGDAPRGLCPKCLVQAALDDRGRPEVGDSDPAVSPTLRSPAGSGGAFQPPPPAELAGLLPQLEILELIGQGGMGAVYKARQRALDRLVAVKILPREMGHDPAFSERFTREARALARLSHTHIVAVYEFGETAGLFYIVMEYVDGSNLRQRMQAGKLTAAEALVIVPRICDALQYAHDEGIVHRDIKPENILIDRKGRVKIADFGLAKLLRPEAIELTLTGRHQVLGTLRYMAPEQMEGARAVDHRADIYSLGVMFYEMLTGEVPAGRFEPPSGRVAIDARLDDVVLRALAREPENRYQQISDMQSQIQAITSGPAGGSRVEPLSAASVSDGSSVAGLSRIVERELRGAWRWIKSDNGPQRAAQPPAVLPVRLMMVLGLAGCLTLLLPWLDVHVPQDANVQKDFSHKAVMAAPYSLTVYGFERPTGIAAGLAFGVLTLLLMMVPAHRPLSWQWGAELTAVAASIPVLTFMFHVETAAGYVPLKIVQTRPAGSSGGGEDRGIREPVAGPGQAESFESVVSYSLWRIEHEVKYQAGFYGSLALSAALLVLSGAGVRRALASGYREPEQTGRLLGNSLAQIRFAVAGTRDIARHADFHFSALGYELMEQRPDLCSFRRGQRWAGIWESDIRRFYTVLTVRVLSTAVDSAWVNCDWKVSTCGSWVTRRDIEKLEREGHEFAALLTSFAPPTPPGAVRPSQTADLAAGGAASAPTLPAVPVLNDSSRGGTTVDREVAADSILSELQQLSRLSRASEARVRLRGPAIALMGYALFAVAAAFFAFSNGFDISDGNDSAPAAVGWALMGLSALLLVFAGLLVRGGWHMLALENYRAAVLASLIGQPLGLWGLFVLSRSDVKSAFAQSDTKRDPA